MKLHYSITFPVLLLSFMLHSNAEAQNIRGDTIFVDAGNVVSIEFPDQPDKATPVGEDALFEVRNLGKNSLSIRAFKKDAKNQGWEVSEGGRSHLFVLSFKEGSPPRRIDLSTLRKLRARVALVKKNVSIALTRANGLYERAKNTVSNLDLWKEVAETYMQLADVADLKDMGMVKSRLEESRTQVQQIRFTKYDEAMNNGRSYFSMQKYAEAHKTYFIALEFKPGDVVALKNISFNDSMWAKEYVDKGDAAAKMGNFVEALNNYKKALDIKPGFPLLQAKLNGIKQTAETQIYNDEKKKGDDFLRAGNLKGARKAYEAALVIRLGDRYIQDQLQKVKIEEDKIAQDEKNEAAYQDLLASAKRLAEIAFDRQGYDLAIKEYKRALAMIPTRKFPVKKIQEITYLRQRSRPR